MEAAIFAFCFWYLVITLKDVVMEAEISFIVTAKED